jgi:hypothetical protein
VTDLEQLRSTAETVTGFPFALYAWQQTPSVPAWGTVNLVSEIGSVWGDDEQQEQALTGQLHLFTRRAGNADMKVVQQALAREDISWRLSAVQYEQDTRLLHYTWVWSDLGVLP